MKDWLGLTVVAALVSSAVTLLGIFLKEWFFARSIEQWKQKRALEQTYQRFRDPLGLATRELASRLREILDSYPSVYLSSAVRASNPQRQLANSEDDPYYRRYKLTSTIYRFCALLGWIELYRQEITFLHLSDNLHTDKLESSLSLFRRSFADGDLNQADDFDEWRDTLIFREELRAMGEAMLESRGSSRTVMGYAKFFSSIEDTSTAISHWGTVASNFFLDLEVDRDFRKQRMAAALCQLVDMCELLNNGKLDDSMSKARKKWTSLVPSNIQLR